MVVHVFLNTEKTFVEQLEDVIKYTQKLKKSETPPKPLPTDDVPQAVLLTISEIQRVLGEFPNSRAMEGVLNLVIAIIHSLSAGNRLKTGDAFAKCLMSDKEGEVPKLFTRLKVIFILLNTIPKETSEDLKDTIVRIHGDMLKWAVEAELMQYISTDVEAIADLARQWQLSGMQVVRFWRNVLSALGHQLSNAQKIEALTTLLRSADAKVVTELKTEAIELIVCCIEEQRFFSFAELLVLKPIQSLKGSSPFYDLLIILAQSNEAEYKKFVSSNKALLTQHNLNIERGLWKMKVLLFLSVADKQRVLTYEDMTSKFGLSEGEIEAFIINVSVAKVGTFKIDQQSRQIHVETLYRKSFNEDQWKVLRDQLSSWKEQLTKVIPSQAFGNPLMA